MGFPVVWAAAMVGTDANGTTTTVIAIAASIDIFAGRRRRMFWAPSVKNRKRV